MDKQATPLMAGHILGCYDLPPMRFRVLLCLMAGLIFTAISLAQPTTGPATVPTTRPALTLHAQVASSDEVDLKWFDGDNTYKRYFIDRSVDGGKTFKRIGHEEGGAGTGPGYTHADKSVDESTVYDYRLETPDYAVISAVV